MTSARIGMAAGLTPWILALAVAAHSVSAAAAMPDGHEMAPDPAAAASGAVPADAASAARPQRAGPPKRTQVSHQQKMSGRAELYYNSAWGVEKLRVGTTMSGNLIRFSWRVTDPEKAKMLNEKRNTPMLEAPRSNAILQVPVMDKVGMLRQAVTPVVGQEYWMVFSNKGNLVRQGDRVNVVIGSFHADGLVIE